MVDALPLPLLAGYWVAERWEGGKLLGRWTTEEPGRSGPPDLYQRFPELRREGWTVYWADRS